MKIIDGSLVTRRDENQQRKRNEIPEVTHNTEANSSAEIKPKTVSQYKKKKADNEADADKQRRMRRLLYILQIIGTEKDLAAYFGFQIQRVRVWFCAHQPPDEALIDLMEFAIASNAERACGFKDFVKKIRLLEKIDVTEKEGIHLTDRERTIKEIFVRYRENKTPFPALYEEYGPDLVNAMKSFFNILDD